MISYFKFDDCTLVVVHIAIVGSREDGDHDWEFRWSIPFVHLVPVELGLMSSQDGQKSVFVEESIGCRLPKEIRTSSYIVLCELSRRSTFFVFYRI